MVSYSFTLEAFEYFLLIMVRITSFVMTAPFFNLDSFPGRVKIGFSGLTSILLFYTLPAASLDYDSVYGYAIIIIKEAMTGLLLGFATNICTYIVLFSGRLIDMEVGLSMATVMDPTTREQSSLTGTFYNNMIMMMLVVLDMHLFIFRSFVDCFEVIPISQAIFDYDHLYQSMITFITDYMVIGFRIILPVFVSIMLLNVILAIMAKVAPQMNMFAVGMQLKIIVGFMVLYVVTDLMTYISNYVFEEMKKMMVLFARGMY